MNKAAMILRLSANDFKTKYAGSALGSLWAVAEPLVTVAIYCLVYTIAFGGEVIGETPYYLWLICGMAAWFYFSDGLRSVSGVYREYSFLIKKMSFDKRILPYIKLISNLFSHMIFLVLTILVLTISGRNEMNVCGFLCLAASVLLNSLFIISLGSIFSIIGAMHRDFLNVLNIFVNIFFWATPIFWNSSILGGGLAAAERYNPISIIVDCYRSTILGDLIVEADRIVCLIALCAVLLITGVLLGRKYSPTIADVL